MESGTPLIYLLPRRANYPLEIDCASYVNKKDIGAFVNSSSDNSPDNKPIQQRLTEAVTDVRFDHWIKKISAVSFWRIPKSSTWIGFARRRFRQGFRANAWRLLKNSSASITSHNLRERTHRARATNDRRHSRRFGFTYFGADLMS